MLVVAGVFPLKTIHLSPYGSAHPSFHLSSPCCSPFAGGEIRRLLAQGSRESGWWSCWRSGPAPFNTASTSNNSRLWQLCIIHLVESLSFLLATPLSLSLQFFSSSRALWMEERGIQGSVPSDAASFAPNTSDFGETEVFVCSTLPSLCVFWKLRIWTRLCWFFIEAQLLNPLLMHVV